MSRPLLGYMPNGAPIYAADSHVAIDYVREDFIEAYVRDALTRWGSVEVSKEYDAGPGGYHGATHVPAQLDHPLAGQTFPATQEGE